MGRAGLFLLPLPGPMGPAVWHIDFVRATRGARRCPAGGHGAAAGSEGRKDANSLPSFSAQPLFSWAKGWILAALFTRGWLEWA